MNLSEIERDCIFTLHTLPVPYLTASEVLKSRTQNTVSVCVRAFCVRMQCTELRPNRHKNRRCGSFASTEACDKPKHADNILDRHAHKKTRIVIDHSTQIQRQMRQRPTDMESNGQGEQQSERRREGKRGMSACEKRKINFDLRTCLVPQCPLHPTLKCSDLLSFCGLSHKDHFS